MEEDPFNAGSNLDQPSVGLELESDNNNNNNHNTLLKFSHPDVYYPQNPQDAGRRFRNSTRPRFELSKHYFDRILPDIIDDAEQNKVISTVIPVYNESWDGLYETLKSLHAASLQITPSYKVTYLIVQDGWAHIHSTMKENLKIMYPSELWDELAAGTYNSEIGVTYIFQNRDNANKPSQTHIPKPDAEYDDYQAFELDIALILKRDNRKKHNSHEWFFSEDGYCGFQQPEFCLATDCATIFDANCLRLMVEVMNKEGDCAVCTARQVCMTAQKQRTQDTLVEFMYRQAQTYDFESSFSTFMGAFAIFGFLPVVPGPCGLYRWSLMKKDANSEDQGPLEWYFDIVNKPPEECGLILANLKIAEDRILSYSAVLKTSRETTMQIHPDAEFYFEAETDLELFAKQRRRWINGTFAGYVYLLMNLHLIFNSKMSSLRKLAVLFLIMCQLGIYAIVFVTPAIFLSALYSVLFWIFPSADYSSTMPLVLWMAYIAFYIYFSVVHTRKAFVTWTFYIQMILSMFTITLTFAAAVYYFATGWLHDSWFERFPVTMTFAVMVAPLVISLHRPKSCIRAAIAFVPFYLFLPTLVAWFGCYSVSRFSDLSWGNRPAGDSADHSTSANAKKKIEAQAFTWNAIVILFNLVMILLYVQKDNEKYFVFSLAILVCSFSAIQMGISVLYFLFHFLMEKFLIRSTAEMIRLSLNCIAPTAITLKPNHQDLHGSVPSIFDDEKTVFSRSSVMLTSFQLATSFCWQYIFQTVPQILHSYHEESEVHNAALNFVFPIFGIIYFVMGSFGDRLRNKEKTFRRILVVGVVCYVISTLAFGLTRSFGDFNDDLHYWTLKAQSYTQGFFLNICGAAYLVLFLLFTPSKELLHYVGIKAVMGALGNVLTSVATLFGGAANPTIMNWTLNILGCFFLVVSLVCVLATTKHKPRIEASSGDLDTNNGRRRVAIVLLTFFFFSAAIAPIQYGLRDFVFHLFGKSDNKAFRVTIAAYLGQEIILLIGGLLMIKSRKTHIKPVTVVLALTSLAQLLFFIPEIDEQKYAVIFLFVWFGLYRIVPEIYCYYFFARDIQGDKRIGFWVASMNTVLVIAQIVGYPMVAAITMAINPLFRYAIATAGIFCAFGIASAWRIHQSSKPASIDMEHLLRTGNND